ncbi:AAA family ATPase [Desulfobacterota bacterium M19]
MPKPAELFVFMGLIASGKSTLAAAWARQIGARYFNSDRERKALAGLSPATARAESFQAGIYSPEFSRRTYERLYLMARAGLEAKQDVVLDGSYTAEKERRRLRDLTAALGVAIKFILCHCPENITRERLELRAQDPEAVSDGRWEIYLRQKKYFSRPAELKAHELITLNTNAPVDTLLQKIKIAAAVNYEQSR